MFACNTRRALWQFTGVNIRSQVRRETIIEITFCVSLKLAHYQCDQLCLFQLIWHAVSREWFCTAIFLYFHVDRYTLQKSELSKLAFFCSLKTIIWTATWDSICTRTCKTIHHSVLIYWLTQVGKNCCLLADILNSDSLWLSLQFCP